MLLRVVAGPIALDTAGALSRPRIDRTGAGGARSPCEDGAAPAWTSPPLVIRGESPPTDDRVVALARDPAIAHEIPCAA